MGDTIPISFSHIYIIWVVGLEGGPAGGKQRVIAGWQLYTYTQAMDNLCYAEVVYGSCICHFRVVHGGHMQHTTLANFNVGLVSGGR